SSTLRVVCWENAERSQAPDSIARIVSKTSKTAIGFLMSPIFERILETAAKPERIVVGLISGTSADSIAVAVCRIHGGGVPGPGRPGAEVDLLQYFEHPYDLAVRQQVRGAADLRVREVAELGVRVGALFAEACLAGLEAAGLAPGDADLVGSHGQTL